MANRVPQMTEEERRKLQEEEMRRNQQMMEADDMARDDNPNRDYTNSPDRRDTLSDYMQGNVAPMEEKPIFDKKHNTLSTDKIGVDQIRKARETLKKYKEGKSKLEDKIVKNEQWYKMRHWSQIDLKNPYDPKPSSGWLFNCIISKHADFMDSVPSPVVLPRESGDRDEAKMLSSIIPVIMEQNDFEATYAAEADYKLKHGTGVYGCFWDSSKLNGLGDITIKSVDMLSLFWEPGITDIQQSRNLFSVELVDNDVLEEQFEVTKGLLKSGQDDSTLKTYIHDDTIDTSNKSLVIDWYYKRMQNGRQVLHYCKFVDEIVLYATENDTKQPTKMELQPVINSAGQQVIDEEGLPMMENIEVPYGEPMSVRGWYDHGMYPYVFDVLFPEAGTPVGFGFVDVCKDSQTTIDVLNNAIEKNAIWGANPRYFERIEGSINEEEFLDPSKPIVHVSGNLGADSISPIVHNGLDGNYLTFINNKIEEMKETAGNRDTANGGTTSGVTAASAIAAMQEQSGKTSRDMIKTTYNSYRKLIIMVIELIRQFYDKKRKFRIMGNNGQEEYVEYDNANLQPIDQGEEFGVDMGYRLPVFDVKVSAQKENLYTQISQNEMALQFYNAGFFNPQMTDQVLACMDMMEFQGKDEVVQKIAQNGGMYQQIQQMQAQMLQMAEMIDAQNGSNLSGQMAAGITGQEVAPSGVSGDSINSLGFNPNEEGTHMSNAREQSLASTAPR